MAARAFQIQVQGLLDGATALIVPDPLPAPVAGVTKIDAGAGIDVGTIDLCALLGTTAPIWVRAFQVEYAALTRAARMEYQIPGQRTDEPVAQILAGSPPLMRLLTLSPKAHAPIGTLLSILTDDTDETFTGAPVAGPHFVYLELDDLPTDEEVGLVTDLESFATTKLNAESQEGSSFQAVAATASEDLLITQAPNPDPDAASTLMSVATAEVTIGVAPAAGESMTIDIVRVRDATGATTTIASIVIDDTFAAQTKVPIPITQLSNIFTHGDRLRVVRTYVAGGGPAPLDNTLVTVTMAPILF